MRNFQKRRHFNGARLALYTVHCGLNESRVRNFQQRRHCSGAHLVLHIVHCGLKESRAYFQQRRQFNGARLVPYHRSHIMAEHDTNNIQAMLFCPHFDGKDKAHFWITRTSFASSCRSIDIASPPFSRAIRSRQPHKILRPWRRGSARTRTSSASCSSPRSVLPTTW